MSVTTNYHQLVRSGRLLPLDDYDKIIVSFSGGKDSQSLVFFLEEMGVGRDRIELWHQHVDGEPRQHNGLMDWPSTPSYCEAFASALGYTLRAQWKDQGIQGELFRDNARTKGVYYEDGEGIMRYLPPSTRGKDTTRRRWPAKSANLSTRWCSSYVKIDVAARALGNDPRFKTGNYLFLTGERRQESAARAKYAEAENHRCNGKRRRVDHFRAVIDWPEQEVWNMIQSRGVVPHPAYRLGYGRLSCMFCIFADPDQWDTNRVLDCTRFDRIAKIEQELNHTIDHKLTVVQMADKGTRYVRAADPELRELALSTNYPADQILTDNWQLPEGAYKATGGPT